MKRFTINIAFEVSAKNVYHAADILAEKIQDAVVCQVDDKELFDALVDTTLLDVEEIEEG